MYVPAPHVAVAGGGYFVTERYCGLLSILIAFFFWPVGGFLVCLCPVDQRQTWVQTGAAAVVITPGAPVGAPAAAAAAVPVQYAAPPPQQQQRYAQLAQAQPAVVMAQPVQQQHAVASAPPTVR